MQSWQTGDLVSLDELSIFLNLFILFLWYLGFSDIRLACDDHRRDEYSSAVSNSRHQEESRTFHLIVVYTKWFANYTFPLLFLLRGCSVLLLECIIKLSSAFYLLIVYNIPRRTLLHWGNSNCFYVDLHYILDTLRKKK